jgi:hypothetical protein
VRAQAHKHTHTHTHNAHAHAHDAKVLSHTADYSRDLWEIHGGRQLYYQQRVIYKEIQRLMREGSSESDAVSAVQAMLNSLTKPASGRRVVRILSSQCTHSHEVCKGVMPVSSFTCISRQTIRFEVLHEIRSKR